MGEERDFLQEPPRLRNQYADDVLLRSALRHTVPPEVLAAVEPELQGMGDLAAGDLYRLQQADRLKEPVLTRYDPWGRHVDHLELTPLWQRAEQEAARRGLVALAYERPHGAWSRVHQMALVYLFSASSDIYSCPLAMTDGAAAALLASGNQALIERAVPSLTSRDPDHFATSGQWMTELAGGSDVGGTRTAAHQGEDGVWRLTGRKWFTSAVASPVALTLARPDGNPDGGKGLALFYVETRDADGNPNHLRIGRLKDKLGTRKLPTAELWLEGTPAIPVAGLTDGVKAIAPMLNIPRTWNAVNAVALLRRGLALARDYSVRRVAFGSYLMMHPLHADTLAGLQAEFEGAFHLTFRVVELLGKEEAGEATEDERALLRLLTPIAKLTTAKQAVAGLSEVIECFGGAGYVEDTGIPKLLRDAQVLPIWEGTTNILSLDLLRVLGQLGEEKALGLVRAEVERCRRELKAEPLLAATGVAADAVDHAARWLHATQDDDARQAGARRLALTLGRALELALLCRHGEWIYSAQKPGHEDGRGLVAARRLVAHGIDQINDLEPQEAMLLSAAPRPDWQGSWAVEMAEEEAREETQ
jgi:alkylation response protein AidB-like acyl-CoA dehydrogenase